MTRTAPATSNSSSRRTTPVPIVVLGEIRTCLLPHSTTLDGQATEELLALVPGATVRRRERPAPLAFSPPRAVGVDCYLSWGSTAETRVVGTVSSTAILVGGRLSQMSSHTTVMSTPRRKRQPWSHYVDRFGTTEAIDTLPDRSIADEELIAGYLTASGPKTLDLSSICARQLDELLKSPLLDQDPPLLAPTTRLRWTVKIGGTAGPAVSFRLDDEATRTANITVRVAEEIPDAVRFCQDLAVHDWLLTVIDAKVLAAAGVRSGDERQLDVLAAMLEHLGHLWMPGAHTPDAMRSPWRELQSKASFSKQWDTRLRQLRDRIVVATYRGGLVR
ncbi:hypothetical protein GFY24_02705 [Nocardia sp. SYP-A9097]|uniref:SCO2521 family protein n=1 Tax=Nocardia sp. SYP-A9097 TaxID=2663237 RepID=UPI00129A1329|nr:SCO2521 family protein [Nocardia sp. SYP-A9097]MRH86388.1 hypothetical protein [Nocardia sp. SYP-A9097]